MRKDTIQLLALLTEQHHLLHRPEITHFRGILHGIGWLVSRSNMLKMHPYRVKIMVFGDTTAAESIDTAAAVLPQQGSPSGSTMASM